LKTLVVLAAVAAFGTVMSAALIIFGQRLSGQPTPRWLRTALTLVPVLAVVEAVGR
jgi:hypothetical protein